LLQFDSLLNLKSVIRPSVKYMLLIKPFANKPVRFWKPHRFLVNRITERTRVRRNKSL